MNTMSLDGNLGKDPEVRISLSGKPIVKFRVADNYKDRGEEKTQWWPVVMFQSEKVDATGFAEAVKKGDRVKVSGPLRARTWTDRDGNEHNDFELICFHAERVERKERTSENDPANAAKEQRERRKSNDDTNDDFPF